MNWIKAIEQKPEPGERVLVATAESDEVGLALWQHCEWRIETLYGLTITHWMPLPLHPSQL